MGWTDFQLITSLGIAPVAAPQSAVANEVWTDPALTRNLDLKFGSKGTGNDAMPPLEEIAATRPDLLLYSGRDLSKLFGQVSPIAPVVASTTRRTPSHRTGGSGCGTWRAPSTGPIARSR
ncbi:ABC transporter substrate-binding protein [Tsukamurella sp. PLM1]|uniref:ABC transporter substrate-binding protein n=1 Tax=Tsukamurella sp. PLM1 TaxID=2929795 RepID=UPI002111A099|nr:hypothetical protein [Tsukamurella sp. PLM1]